MDLRERLQALTDDQGGHPEEDWLISGRLIGDAEPRPGGANETWAIELDRSGEQAFFKGMNGVNAATADAFGHTKPSVVVSEVVAWRLARQMGSPWNRLVAPCVLRTVEEIDARAPGSLCVERFGEREDEPFAFFLTPRACLAAAFFDAVIGNQDRRWTNFKLDRGRDELALLDHGFAFPDANGVLVDSMFLDWRLRLGWMRTTPAELEVLGALLASGDLFGAARYLEAERAQHLNERVDKMHRRGQLLAPDEIAPA